MLYMHLASLLTFYIGSKSSDFNFKLSYVSLEESSLSNLCSFLRGSLIFCLFVSIKPI